MGQNNFEENKMKLELGLFTIVSFCSLIGSALIGNILMDQLIVLVCIHTLMLFLFIMSLHLEKIQNLNSYNKNRRYGRFIGVYLTASVVMILANWIPGFWEPVLGFTILLILGSTPTIGFSAGLYLVVIQTILFEYSTIEMSKLIFCVLVGGILALFMKKQSNLMPVAILVFLSQPCIGFLFEYLEHYQVDFRLFITGLIYGCVNVAIIIVPYSLVNRSDQEYYATTLEYLIDPRFQLLTDMKSCSDELFLHGLKVSKAAGNCAQKLGLNDKLVRAGGLFYRLGYFEDENSKGDFPGHSLGMEHHFPEEVLSIIQEYKGICKTISTPEAALIDIVDEVFKQFEKDEAVQGEDNLAFNQEFLIYKIMNDCSGSGRYDHSGFSMNMYLNVRDYLVKEVDYHERFYIK